MVNKPKKKRGPIWLEAPFLVGLVITSFVFGVAVWSLAAGEVCDALEQCTSKWEALKLSPPNEIGDALAGFAGTLAFVWLIVTVWLQATELREQREEFEKMADAQEAQVGLLVTQGEIFADEQRQRVEDRAKLVMEQQVRSVQKFLMLQPRDSLLSWLFQHRAVQQEFETDVYRSVQNYTGNEEPDEFCAKLLKGLFDQKRMVTENSGDKFRDFWIRATVVGFDRRLEAVERIAERLSEDQKIRVQTMGIQNIRFELEQLLEDGNNLLSDRAEEI